MLALHSTRHANAGMTGGMRKDAGLSPIDRRGVRRAATGDVSAEPDERCPLEPDFTPVVDYAENVGDCTTEAKK